MSEPIPVIPLAYADPGDQPRSGWNTTAAIAAALALSCVIVGWLLLMWEVESVLATGPALFILGAIMTICGVRLGAHWYIWQGSVHCALCLLFFALVNVRNWSPQHAEKPFMLMGGLYALAASVSAAIRWLSRTR